MEFQLTDNQEAAIQTVLNMFEEGDTFATLRGSAGTGKTTIILELINRAEDYFDQVFVTAPTNKATKVLAEKTGKHAITIYKMLGLVLKDQETEQILEQAGRIQLEPDERVLLIVDEASMMNQELMGLVDEMVAEHDLLYVLFVGDPYQLNPIKEEESRAMTYEGYELTEVLRQAADNPVIQLAQHIRDLQTNNVKGSIPYSSYIDGTRIVHHRAFGHFIGAYLEKFRANESAHLVAWTNNKVNEMNRNIRRKLYGADAKQPFLIDEEVMLYEPLFETTYSRGKHRKNIVLENSALAIVADVQQTVSNFPGGLSFDTWLVELDADNYFHQAFVPANPAEVTNELKAIAKRAVDGDPKKRGLIFRDEYYPIKNHFIDIRPSHAMTAHKSQGSTFDSVFVDVQNISFNKNDLERLRCLYVAITRCAKELHLYGI